jgi:hypothetical protein
VLSAVVMLAMIAALWVAYRRGARPRRVLVVPRDSAETLAAAIAALDARHDAHDPTLPSETYAAERAALKTRLAAALAGGVGAG